MRYLAIFAVLVLAACSSISSTAEQEGVTAYKGMPIVLDQPTKVAYLVTRTTYRRTVGSDEIDPDAGLSGTGLDSNAAAQPSAQRKTSTFTKTTLSDPITFSRQRVFFVDVKRPFSGTGEFKFEFAEGQQFPKHVSGSTTDKTLENVQSILEDAAKKALGMVEKQAEAIDGVTVDDAEIIASDQFFMIYDVESGHVSFDTLPATP